MDRNGFQSVTLPASAVHLTWPNTADATHSAQMAHGVARTNTLSNCGGGRRASSTTVHLRSYMARLRVLPA